MNTYLLSALMSIHLVYGSVFACDVQVHVRFDHDVYYEGERIVLRLSYISQCSEAIKITSGVIRFGLIGALELFDSTGVVLKPHVSTDGAKEFMLKPNDTISVVVPLNVYGALLPYAMSPTPPVGRYQWRLSIDMWDTDGERIGHITKSGSIAVSPWPESDREFMRRLLEVEAGAKMSIDHYNTLSILDKSNSSERAQIVFMDRMRFYQKMLGLKDEYIATMTWISALCDKHLSCKHIRDTENKIVEHRESDFTKPDQEE